MIVNELRKKTIKVISFILKFMENTGNGILECTNENYIIIR